MGRIKYDDTYEYEIFEDGYDIFFIGTQTPYITQRDPYGKVFKHDGTYEENALIQLAEITKPVEPSIDDKNRADIDYLALMMDVELPSYDEEGE